MAAIVLSALILGACGGSGETTDEGVGLPPPGSTRPNPVPSTTTPVLLAPVDCTVGALEVAERVLIERRRGIDVGHCGGNSVGEQFEGCWTECGEDKVFVDFDFDPAGPIPIDTTEAAGETVSLAYAARYSVDSDGTITEAEKLVLRRADPTSPWQIIDVVVTDTAAARDDALTTIEVYFAALRNGDYAAAATLVAPAASIEGRDDLGRLADEGFLTGTSAAEIAEALELWCDNGAECAATPGVEIEVTATHSLRAIATYQLPLGTFETTFLVDENGIVGLPIKVG